MEIEAVRGHFDGGAFVCASNHRIEQNQYEEGLWAIVKHFFCGNTVWVKVNDGMGDRYLYVFLDTVEGHVPREQFRRSHGIGAIFAQALKTERPVSFPRGGLPAAGAPRESAGRHVPSGAPAKAKEKSREPERRGELVAKDPLAAGSVADEPWFDQEAYTYFCGQREGIFTTLLDAIRLFQVPISAEFVNFLFNDEWEKMPSRQRYQETLAALHKALVLQAVVSPGRAFGEAVQGLLTLEGLIAMDIRRQNAAR